MKQNTSPDVAPNNPTCCKNATQKVAIDQTNTPIPDNSSQESLLPGSKGLPKKQAKTERPSATRERPAPPPGGWRRQDGTTRAERRAANQARKLAVETQELAKTKQAPAGVKVKVQFKATGEGEMLPQEIERPRSYTADGIPRGGPAKRITAVDTRERTGRPSEYTEEEADAICAWISRGGSLNSYCDTTGRGHVTVFRWLREHALFHSRYSLALENRADTIVDEMQAIADESAQNPTMEGVQAAKLRVETRRWIASKLKSRVYGDRVEVKQTGAVSIRLGIGSQAPQKPQEVIDVTPEKPRLA